MVLQEFTKRYKRVEAEPRRVEGAAVEPTREGQRFRDAQRVLALVYAAIRHDEAAVKAVDRVLKEGFGGGS